MKIMFFSPHAYITVHSIPEAVVIEALKERGHDIITVNCDGALSGFCVSMSASGILPQATAQEKDAVCHACRERRDLIENEFHFPSIMLDKYIREDEEQAIESIILKIRPENYIDLIWMDIPIGRYALYEFLLNNKLNSVTLNGRVWEEYKIYLYNTLKAAYAGKRILEDVKPGAVVTYNSLYSANHVVCALAEQRGIPHYTLHAGGHIKRRYATMTIFKGLLASTLITRNDFWKKLSHKPISPLQIQVVAEHILELLKATDPWVYSIASKRMNSESLRKRFGISNDKSVLLATMASADERFAMATIDALPPFVEPMFPTQIEWINTLIEFARQRSDLFLIIRAHPREFPNKREQVLSNQAIKLQELFVNLPDNVRVNWPQDEISLHDLIKITDVGLNATSTTGIEFGMFGVPVVIYDTNQLFSYPAENNYIADNVADYFNKIDLAIKDGWSLENVRKTFRWLSYKFEHVAIDISDGFGMSEKRLSILEKIQDYLLRKVFGRRSKDLRLIRQIRGRSIPVRNSELLSIAIERNLESHLDLEILSSVEFASFEDETTALREQIAGLVNLIWDESDKSGDLNQKINKVVRDA